MTTTSVSWSEQGVTVGGLWTYAWAAGRRPFIHPVTTPAGHVLSRDAPDDHPWHHGLWFTIKFVDGDNFWEEMPPYGVLRHAGPPEVVHLGPPHHPAGAVSVTGTLAWTRPDRETVALTEHRCFTHVPLADHEGHRGYAIDLDTALVAVTAVHLDRTEFTTWGGYGGLTLRGSADLVDTRLLLADGSIHQKLTGTRSAWCDLSGRLAAGGGSVSGSAHEGLSHEGLSHGGAAAGSVAPLAGLALFDHPANRRFPTPFYASTFDGYGEGAWTNFFNAAFLWEGGMDLTPGEELRIRHRAVVHDGHWPVTRLQAEWEAWSAT